MNKVILTGYISTDLELKHTQQNTPVCSFRLGIRQSKDKYDFFTVVCWKSTAEFLVKHFSKGDGIEVSGRLTTRTWQDKATGKNRVAVEITADAIDFGKGGKADDAQIPPPDSMMDDDLPF